MTMGSRKRGRRDRPSPRDLRAVRAVCSDDVVRVPAEPPAHGARRFADGGCGLATARFPIPGRAPISERPPEAGDRSGFGHWEADGVIGAGCDLHTEVERKTRFLMAGIVPDKTAGESVGAQLAMFSPLPAGARVGVTHDNGTEFARHTRLRDELGMDTCFADPYSTGSGEATRTGTA